jgi:hypothetical protein
MKNIFYKKISLSVLLSTIVFTYASSFIIQPQKTTAQGIYTQQQTQGVQQGTKVENASTVKPAANANSTSKNTGCVSTKDDYCLLEPLVIDGVAQKSVNIQNYVKTMFKIGIGLAALFAVFMIIVGGFQYMTSESIGGKGDGKEKIEGALWGLGLALGSFLILNTINPQLLEFSGGLEPIVVNRDLAKKMIYKDPALTEALRIGEESRANNASIEALRKRAKELRSQADDAYNKGDTEEASRLNDLAEKTEKEADKLYTSSVRILRYDNAANSIMLGNGYANPEKAKLDQLIDAEIKRLVDSNAPQNEIDSLRAKKLANDQKLRQVYEMYRIKQVLLGGIDDQGVKINSVIAIADSFVKYSKTIGVEINELDQKEAQLFKEFTARNYRAINPLINYRKSCPKDFSTDYGGIGSRVMVAAFDGMVAGGVVGAAAGTFTFPVVGTGVGAVVGGTLAGASRGLSQGMAEMMYGQPIPCQAN